MTTYSTLLRRINGTRRAAELAKATGILVGGHLVLLFCPLFVRQRFLLSSLFFLCCLSSSNRLHARAWLSIEDTLLCTTCLQSAGASKTAAEALVCVCDTDYRRFYLAWGWALAYSQELTFEEF